MSNDGGSFHHSPDLPSTDVLHFSLDGYIPRSIVVQPTETDMKITLVRGNGKWTIGACAAQSFPGCFDGLLCVTFPKGVKAVRFQDVDYDGVSIVYSRKEVLRIGCGPSWSRGLPDANNLGSSTGVVEKTLFLLGSEEDTEGIYMPSIDVRGTYADGRRWRFTGHAFQTLQYNRVSPKAATFFDAILDTLCKCSK
jgi:hypothetical protein